MTPVVLSPPPPLSTSPPPVFPPPKFRLALYLASGSILLIIIAVASLKIVPYFLQPKTLTPDFQDQSVRLADAELVELVKTEFNISSESLISIEKIEGDYAWGTASITPESVGFYWAAAKTNGEWSYAFGGNGIPECSEVEIFPIGTFDGKFDECYKDSVLVNRKTSCETIIDPTISKTYQLCPNGFYSTKSFKYSNIDPINYITTYLQSPDKKIMFFWKLTETYVNECLKSQGCAGHGQEELLRFDFGASNFKVVETVNSPDSYPPQDKSPWSKTNGISFSAYDGKVYYCENACAIIAQDGPQPPEEAGYSYIENNKVFYMSKDGKIKTVVIQ